MTPLRTFVTGASSGLGRAIALHYARRGGVVGICARRAELLAEVAHEIEALGARAHAFVVDVSDTGAMASAAAEFVEKAGGVDLVIANAGMGIPSTILEGKPEPVAQLMKVNVIGVTNTVVPFVPAMVSAKRGVLVAVSSAAGLRGLPKSAPYSASKAAVIAFMEGLRMELHGTGVHAMAVCPGFVRTPMTSKAKKMPFALEADEAAALIAGAIERCEGTFIFPWQIRLLGRFLRQAPEWVLRRLVRARTER